jgi:hypothetical protein
LDGGKDATLEGSLAFVAVYQNTCLIEVGLAAAVEILVGLAQLAQIVGSFGSLVIW